MKYVITGGAGNISKPLTEKLLKAGHEVTVVGRNAEHLKSLKGQGAKAAVGSVEDTEFLKKTFEGADAVYTMIPPNWNPTNWKNWIGQIGKNYAEAIQEAKVKYVVNLSSVGAHLPEGGGPVNGLHRVEEALNNLKGINVKHLRPNYFFANLLSNANMVKQMNIMGGNFGGDNFKMVLSDTGDVAEVAFEELNNLKFTGHSVRYIASDERSTSEIAKAFGTAVGKPALPWVVFSDDQTLDGLVKAGIPEEIARNYAEMGHAFHSGKMLEDYWKNHPDKLGRTKLEDFAKTFAHVFASIQ
jgi:uncharacterized protein YbjT (DUF2867 family)